MGYKSCLTRIAITLFKNKRTNKRADQRTCEIKKGTIVVYMAGKQL